MLLELKVQNFAIINGLDVEFKPGLNILSGETGAGKSVILKSLALLMGEKALADTVRSGAALAEIEGYFDLSKRPDIIKSLENLGIDCTDETLIVRRQISTQGKSKVYINGVLSALNNLKEIVSPLITVTGTTAPLIEMTGQHESRSLQSRAYHLELLDLYANCWSLRQEFEKGFSQLKSIRLEMTKIQEDSRNRELRRDFLVYQRDEIKALNLSPGEDADLDGLYQKMKNSKRLGEFVSQAESTLYGDDDSALVRLHQIIQRANDLSVYDENLQKKIEPLIQAKTLLEDCVYELRNYGKNLEAEPTQLNNLEERISSLRKLQKKYGTTVADILEQLKKIEDELASLESSDDHLRNLEKDEKRLLLALKSIGEDLHQRRQGGARLLEKSINEELADLNMKGVHFIIQIDTAEEWSPSGMSLVEFMIRSSKNDEPRPMAKIASGGELSRILLSLKRVVGHSDFPHTYLFDEVDTGVSGQTAEKVGRKLKAIASGQQVICVTHLPQVASFADHHYLIEKNQGKNGVRMQIRELLKSERVREIARLISGEKISQTSLDHAKALLTTN